MAFAKLKTLIRKAAARTYDQLWKAVGHVCELFKEEECYSPDGFPRYRDNPGLSDTINKFMRENGLLKTPSHTLYSLRHSFEDRMLASNVDERIRSDLLGHRLSRESYGNLHQCNQERYRGQNVVMGWLGILDLGPVSARPRGADIAPNFGTSRSMSEFAQGASRQRS